MIISGLFKRVIPNLEPDRGSVVITLLSHLFGRSPEAVRLELRVLQLSPWKQ